MFKILNFLVRNPALSPEQFREYYETSHVPLALATFPQIREHIRHYPVVGGAMFPEGVDHQWDAIVEIMLTDRRGFDDMMGYLSDDSKPRDIVIDGEMFLDGPKCGMLIVETVRTVRRADEPSSAHVT